MREDNGNSYLYFEQNNPELDMHVDFNIGKTSPNVVIEMDVRIESPGMEVALVRLTDNVSNDTVAQSNLISFNDMKLLSNGSKIGSLIAEKWHHFDVLLNLSSGKFDLYMDNEMKVNSGNIHSALSFREISSARIYCVGGKNGSMSVDNIRIYDGKVPRDISNEEIIRESVFANDSVAEKFLETKTALNPYMGILYYNGEKEVIDDMPVINGDDIYITKDVANKFLNDISDIEKAEMINENGSDMYLLSDLISLSNRFVYDDNHGLFISSENPFEANTPTLEAAHRRASFVRPEADKIKSDLVEANGEKLDRHPRIVATKEDFERMKNEIQTDSRKKEWYEKILSDTEKIMTAPVSVYDKYDGLRILKIAAEFETRMTNLGFFWQITGDRKYADRAWQEFEAVFKFPDWNAIAHFLDTGTMATGFAIGYDWFYDAFTPQQRQMIYDSALKNGLSQYQKAIYGCLDGDASFVKNITNHSPTCNGGIIELALAVAEHNPDYCSDLISDALKSLEYVWYYFAPDGAWHEGTGYWQATIWDSTLCLSAMNTSLNTDYNMARYKGFNQLPFFVPSMAGPTGKLYNFHDTGNDYRSSPALFWMANKFDDTSAATLRLKYMGEYDIEPEVYDMLWCDSEWDSSSEIKISKDRLYEGLEMVLMRSSFNDVNSSFLAFHGAETSGGHNHCDSGAFVYEIDGVRWAEDLGVDMQCYYVDYSERNKYYRIRAEGHNSVVINPGTDAGHDSDGYAPIIRYEPGADKAISVIDLSSCYKSQTSGYLRGFRFTDNRRVLTVRDEIDLSGAYDMYWFMHTGADIEITGKTTATLTYGTKKLYVEFMVEGGTFELSKMNAVPLETSPNPSGQNANSGITKLALKVNGTDKVNITARFSTDGNDERPESLPISDWNIN